MEKYIVFMAYYKQGDTWVKVFSSEEKLRQFMIDEIYTYEYLDDELERLTTGQLIKTVLEMGQSIIDEQSGHGVVYVGRVQGDIQSYGLRNFRNSIDFE